MIEPRPTSSQAGARFTSGPSPPSVPSDATSAGPGAGIANSFLVEMVEAWERGERTPAEVYFARDPNLLTDAEASIQLIYEEVCLRRAAGESVSLSELARRFPRWRAELEVLIECDRLLDAGQGAPLLPSAGETLGDFKLLSELGRGTRGRCFLAAQAALADRRVVLKITSNDHCEHLSLACLQHTHIVPLYSAQEFPERNLRALCMPYLGGATLAIVLADLEEVPLGRRTGRSLLEALGRAGTGLPASGTLSPTKTFLTRTSYFLAICWVGACLADALQYAHDHGLVHMDVKPSNILLAADGQPLLLDFHLARSPLREGDDAPEWLGGTPGYMSPEQGAAVAAVYEGRALPTAVDGRSDLFALGRTLAETVGGTLTMKARGAEVRFPREVPTGLGDLIRKCLADDPSHRYQNAAALADDLRRQMADLPLRGVSNRSLAERWRRWRRRRPAGLLRMKAFVCILIAVVAACAGAWATYVAPRVHAAKLALQSGRRFLSQENYSEAARVLSRGSALIEGLPGVQALSRELAGQTRRLTAVRDADRLHEIVEQLRFFESAASRTVREMEVVERRCQIIWQTRNAILDQLGDVLEADVASRFRSDMLDLAVIGTNLRVRLAAETGDATTARREALQVLDEAAARFGPSRLLLTERLTLAEALGLSNEADAADRNAVIAPPRTASEHYAEGRSLLASGDLERAEAAFKRALALRPQEFWPYFKLGVCAYRRHHYEDAVNAFQVCIALAPNRAEPFYNRALAHEALGHDAQASLDYDRAAKLNKVLLTPHSDRVLPTAIPNR